MAATARRRGAVKLVRSGGATRSRADVSRVEVAERLEDHGVRKSARTVRDVLSRLVRDPGVPVARAGHRYRLTR